MAILSVRNLSYWYPDATEPTIRDISLEVQPGELVLLSGRSGCGKSTFLNCLKGLLPKLYGGRLEGQIEINGRDIFPLSVSSMATEVGLVMQDPDSQMCNLFVKDEVAFGIENLLVPREQCVLQVQQALDETNLSGLADRQVYQLSGGQKQRLAIASVLAMKTPLILLDEPAANLDNKSGREILQLVASLRSSGRTIILVQHELDEMADLADRLLILDKGEFIICEAPRTVFEHYGEHLTSDYGIGLPQVVSTALKTRSKFPFKELPLSPREFAAGIVNVWGAAAPAPQALPPTALPPPNQRPNIIEAEKITYTYPGMKIPAVLDATFSIPEGEVVALIGKNGSGKSTLARLLVGLLKQSTGNIRLEGKDLRRLSSHDVHGSTGYVFQYPEHQFLADSVEKEISYGLEVQCREKSEIDRLVSEIMKLLRLEYVAHRHPFSLSGGEKRRLSVATMMVIEPKLLILDEPTYGLDEGNLINLLGFLFARLRERGITIVFITHDLRLVAEYAERVLVMSEGRLIFEGKPSTMFCNSDMMNNAELLPPPVVETCAQLRDYGWPLPLEIATQEQFLNCLRSLAIGSQKEG